MLSYIITILFSRRSCVCCSGSIQSSINVAFGIGILVSHVYLFITWVNSQIRIEDFALDAPLQSDVQ